MSLTTYKQFCEENGIKLYKGGYQMGIGQNRMNSLRQDAQPTDEEARALFDWAGGEVDTFQDDPGVPYRTRRIK